MNDLSWKAYIEGHPERLPRPISGAVASTWADLKPGEYRRVTRNYQRWRQRRLKWMEERPTHFILQGNEVVVEQYPGRGRQ